MRKTLYQWQDDCLHQWMNNNGRGIVNVVTGAGKTVLALAAIEKLAAKLGDIRVKIVVPKAFLVTQWTRALREDLQVKREDIGCWSGQRKDKPSRLYMIYVINSARYALARHVVTEFETSKPVLLIADECHHYGTTENARIFGFIPFIPNSLLYYSLGLSATPFSIHYNDVLAPSLGRTIYHFGFDQAIMADVINRFALFNIRLSFRDDEESDYNYYTECLINTLSRLKERNPQIRGTLGHRFFMLLETLATSGDPETAQLARAVQNLSFKRKEVMYLAKARIHCVVNLVNLMDPAAKIIIFTERIETTERIHQQLKPRYGNVTGVYHSGMNEYARKNVLRRFEDREIRILVSCKALDEGLNVPETDAGIVVSATNSERQRIQRLGRILRKGGAGLSCLYYLYIGDTTEEITLLNELSGHMGDLTPVTDLEYIESEERFENPAYSELAAQVEAYIQSCHWPEAQMEETRRNIDKGIVLCDWLLTENACHEKIGKAGSKAAKNYYITMLLLIKARMGTLEE